MKKSELFPTGLPDDSVVREYDAAVNSIELTQYDIMTSYAKDEKFT